MYQIYVSLCRYALNEMDKFSLKDSGRGDSEAGDSDYEPGRESPMDRLLGEGFTELYAPDGQHRTHAGTPLAPPSTQTTHPLHNPPLPSHPIITLSSTSSPESNRSIIFHTFYNELIY